ncbi:MAG: zinc metallopeptidase [Solirubrobacterales bacterium]
MFFWDPTYIMIIPAIILSIWAQYKVKSTFAKYSQVGSSRGTTGAELAAALLRRGGLNSVKIEHVPGELSDHYDPGAKILRLSDSVYGSSSVAALGVAAHEVGHAFQHETSYLPLKLRNSLVPVANIGSMAAFPLILIGMFLHWANLAFIGVIVFTVVVAFQMVTLPVEFNASRRAVALLAEGGYVTPQEKPMVEKVLRAAALTYVAAAVVAIMELLRFVVMLGFLGGNDD